MSVNKKPTPILKPKKRRQPFSERELKLTKKCMGWLTVEEAAGSMGLTPATLYNVFYRMRKKYKLYRQGVNTILALRRADSLLDKVLAIKPSTKEETEKLKEKV